MNKTIYIKTKLKTVNFLRFSTYSTKKETSKYNYFFLPNVFDVTGLMDTVKLTGSNIITEQQFKRVV